MNTDTDNNNNITTTAATTTTVYDRSDGDGGGSYSSYDYPMWGQQQPYTVIGGSGDPSLSSSSSSSPSPPSSSSSSSLSSAINTLTTYGNSNVTYTNIGGDMRIISISEDKVTDKILGKMMRGNIKVLIPIGKEETDDEYMECTLADLLKTGLLKFHQL